MLPRERIERALDWTAPDVLPVRMHPSPAGLLEHGEKLLDLLRACGHDFGDAASFTMPAPPPPEDFDTDGRYHAFRTDAWGTRWEYRIFGVWGHPVEWPLDDWSRLDAYQVPPPPPCDGPAVEAARASVARHRERWYFLGGGGSIFETLHSVRRFEDVLMDLAGDSAELGRLADLITDRCVGCVEHALAIGSDAVIFGDDYGTQEDLLVSRQTWRRFFKPRYERMFEPIRRAGKQIFFHSCGRIGPLFEDLRELGVGAIWPQLTAYDLTDLARQCRNLGLAIELHPDRGDMMQRGTPAQVRDYLHRLFDTFGTADGGSWLYVEVDPGFDFACVEAMVQTAMELRSVGKHAD